MRFKIFNRKLPSLEGLNHISYRVNSIDKWFDFYFSAKDRGSIPFWTINHGWISGIYYKDRDNNLVEVSLSIFHQLMNSKIIYPLILRMNQ